jgi:hypothetical protein
MLEMSSKLRFSLELLPHPYPEDSGAAFEVWGRLSISVHTHNKLVKLLMCQWNLDELAEWFIKNRGFLCSERLLIEGYKPFVGESLAQAMARFDDRDFSEDEEEAADRWYDSRYNFYQKHDLSCALSGANIPGIIIGCNHGSGEISFVGDSNSEDYPQYPGFYANLQQWKYSFDMKEFLTTFNQELSRFLASWLPTTQNEASCARIKNILERLIPKNLSDECCKEY